MRLKKALLKVGTYQSPDGTLDVTPQRLRHWESTFRKMQAASLGVPMGWDHSDDPAKTVPVAFSTTKGKKRSAEHSVGWLDEFKVAPDGNAAELTFDIPDEKAAAKAADNVVEVSPIIYPEWRDGKGHLWTDCITHVDLVNHPVDAGQTPFQVAEDAIACSIRMGLDVGKPALYRMADDEEKPKEFGGDDGEKKETDDNPDMPKIGVSEDDKQLEAVIGHLALLTEPVVLPHDTDDTNFMDRLLTALMTAKAAKDAAAARKAEEEKDDEDDDMDKAKESTPEFTAMSLQARAAHGYAERMHRLSLANRLDDLLKSGRCSPAEKEAQKQALSAVKLSLNGEGEPEKSDAEKWIESREVIPPGAIWPNEQRLRMAKESPAPEIAEEISNEQAEEIVDGIFSRGRKPKQLATT